MVFNHSLNTTDLSFESKDLSVYLRDTSCWEDLVVGCAVLCHDLGKPATTTTTDDGRVRALGHEAERRPRRLQPQLYRTVSEEPYEDD